MNNSIFILITSELPLPDYHYKRLFIRGFLKHKAIPLSSDINSVFWKWINGRQAFLECSVSCHTFADLYVISLRPPKAHLVIGD